MNMRDRLASMEEDNLSGSGGVGNAFVLHMRGFFPCTQLRLTRFGLQYKLYAMRTEMPRTTQKQLIAECMQNLRRIVKALEDYSLGVEKRFDLTGPQLWALWEMGRSGPCALKDLAERMKLDSSTVVGVVDRLVSKGLVIRNPDPQDRRRISLAPTAKGEEILAAAPHPAQGHLLVGLEGMDRKKVENLHEALGTLVGVLEAEHLEAPFFFSKE
jgi:DNA-binding MarR family transcriptional regulator